MNAQSVLFEGHITSAGAETSPAFFLTYPEVNLFFFGIGIGYKVGELFLPKNIDSPNAPATMETNSGINLLLILYKELMYPQFKTNEFGILYVGVTYHPSSVLSYAYSEEKISIYDLHLNACAPLEGIGGFPIRMRIGYRFMDKLDNIDRFYFLMAISLGGVTDFKER